LFTDHDRWATHGPPHLTDPIQHIGIVEILAVRPSQRAVRWPRRHPTPEHDRYAPATGTAGGGVPAGRAGAFCQAVRVPVLRRGGHELLIGRRQAAACFLASLRDAWPARYPGRTGSVAHSSTWGEMPRAAATRLGREPAHRPAHPGLFQPAGYPRGGGISCRLTARWTRGAGRCRTGGSMASAFAPWPAETLGAAVAPRPVAVGRAQRLTQRPAGRLTRPASRCARPGHRPHVSAGLSAPVRPGGAR
jgi:hypothetical protein